MYHVGLETEGVIMQAYRGRGLRRERCGGVGVWVFGGCEGVKRQGVTEGVVEEKGSRSKSSWVWGYALSCHVLPGFTKYGLGKRKMCKGWRTVVVKGMPGMKAEGESWIPGGWGLNRE